MFGFDSDGRENEINSFYYLSQYLQKRFACSVYIGDSR